MVYKDLTFQSERSLYHIENSEVINCIFEGEEDGESPLKECQNILVKDCKINLRYPFWHNKKTTINNCKLLDNSRAPFWYCHSLKLLNSDCIGIKPVRECVGVTIDNCKIESQEFGWKSKDLKLSSSSFVGEYFLLDSKNVSLQNCSLKGKYSFQYMDNVAIDNCNLDTKDAFWHSKNVVVTNSILKGEYIGWYSKNLCLINCTIIGTQPFCYCKKLKLINCKMIDADFAFENSEVKASIIGDVISIKNPLKGKIEVDSLGELIIQDYTLTPKCKVITKKEMGNN